MAKSFRQMVQEAQDLVPGVSAQEAQKLLEANPEALLLEVRDPSEIPEDQRAPGSLNISLGQLPIKADLEVPEERREPRLQDRSGLVITT